MFEVTVLLFDGPLRDFEVHGFGNNLTAVSKNVNRRAITQ